METRKQNKIHRLAIETVNAIQKDFDSRMIKSNRQDSLNKLNVFVNNCNYSDDIKIINYFGMIMKSEEIASNGLEAKNSVFISSIKNFLIEAQFMLIAALNEKNVVLELASVETTKTTNRCNRLVEMNTKLEQESSYLYKQKRGLHEYIAANKNNILEPALKHNKENSIFQKMHFVEPQLLNPIFIICSIKELEKLCVTSKFLNELILKMDLKFKKFQYSPFYTGKNGFQLFVKTLTGKIVTLTTDADNTIENVKKMMEYREGVPVNQQRMIFAGKQLQDDRTLRDNKIGKEATITSVLRLSGD